MLVAAQPLIPFRHNWNHAQNSSRQNSAVNVCQDFMSVPTRKQWGENRFNLWFRANYFDRNRIIWIYPDRSISYWLDIDQCRIYSSILIRIDLELFRYGISSIWLVSIDLIRYWIPYNSRSRLSRSLKTIIYRGNTMWKFG